MVRVQAYNVSGKAEKLWNLLPRQGKSKAIEQALILLAQDKKMASIFFDDVEMVEAILRGEDDTSIPKKQKAATTPVKAQNKPQKAPTKKDDDEQVETAW